MGPSTTDLQERKSHTHRDHNQYLSFQSYHPLRYKLTGTSPHVTGQE